MQWVGVGVPTNAVAAATAATAFQFGMRGSGFAINRMSPAERTAHTAAHYRLKGQVPSANLGA